MPRRGVFWSRPVTRAYTYNLNVGENYYAPLTDYLDSTDRSQRGKNFFFGEIEKSLKEEKKKL